MPDPKPDDVDLHDETTDPLVADVRNFYKVEKWTRDGTKVDSLLYAGNNLEKGPRDFRAGRQASAEDQAGHSAADARAGAVAEAGVAHARPLHSQDVEAEQRLSRLSKAFRRGRSSRTLFSLGNSGTYLCVLRGFRPLHYGGSARRQ